MLWQATFDIGQWRVLADDVLDDDGKEHKADYLLDIESE